MLEVNGLIDIPYVADTGADHNFMTIKTLKTLLNSGVATKVEHTPKPLAYTTATEEKIETDEFVLIRISLHTAAGRVNIEEPVRCMILKEGGDEIILGDEFLQSIGINIRRQLEQLSSNIEMEENDPEIRKENFLEEEKSNRLKGDEELKSAIEKLIQLAIGKGFPTEHMPRLKQLVSTHDVWRLDLGDDPPAKVPPLKLKLKPNVQPYRCKPRNYSHDQRAFLKRFCKKLLDRNFIYPNRNSRWASRALPIRKGIDDFRLTSDYQEVNKLVEPLAGMMPFQSNILKHTKGMKFFGLFDFLKGFWQLPLSKDSQEILSFMTDDGIYSPTRVPQGCTDAALHFQATMEECFKQLLYSHLLIWIDDMLLFGKTINEYLDALEKFFKLLVEFGLKLSVKKSSLFEREVTWCGRIIDGQGVRHDPQRLKALIDMPIPETAGELQQFLCASNWLRDSLIDYARVFTTN